MSPSYFLPVNSLIIANRILTWSPSTIRVRTHAPDPQLALGPGSEMRQALGTAVFSGMIGVTLFGIFLTPVFFSVIMKFFGPKGASRPAPVAHEPAPQPAALTT
jgi:hypothetical protein